MKVVLDFANWALISLINDPKQIVFLDANFFIPPDRSSLGKIKPYRFEHFRDIWLDPLLSEFSGVSIHESVYDELVSSIVKSYADNKANSNPSCLKIFKDNELSTSEQALMNTYIGRISVHSLYDPDLNSSKDRGEVFSLSYMAVKSFLFFAANDGLPVRLINDAEKLNTGLEHMGIIQMYELIFYLYKTGKYDAQELKKLYNYQYHITEREKRQNPSWGDFIQQMEALYGEYF